MDIIKTIYSRRSIRCFKSDPIDRNILTEILEAAAKSPSATNAQPWSITVVTGEKLEQIKQGNLKMLSARS